MRFKIFLFVPLLITVNHVFAKPVFDSVGVENQNGKKIILHKIEPKETYFAVGRRYDVKPNIIIQFNNNAVLKPGMTIKVPTERPFEESAPKKAAVAAAPAKTEQYKVSPHETLYSIAKRFGTTVDEVKRQNNLTSDVLTPGEILTFTTGGSAPVKPVAQQESKPVESKPAQVVQQAPQPVKQEPAKQQPVQQAPQPAQQAQQPVDLHNTQQYKVSAGETLYTIAKRFGTSVEDITNLNKLTTTSLSPGQILTVRSGMPPASAQPIVAKADTTSVAGDSVNVDHDMRANRYGLFMKNEKGSAVSMDDPGFDPNKKLVLHRTAPIGTVIKITNPMTNRTTFAKVVGTFTDNENTKDAILVVTKNVADALGVLDKKFRVNISYGVPTNDQQQ
ncbi:LysM domain-containing protein [Mucilaginibacter yixingensis]|uniref:LysM domain-containing protein n=1 Tax=Mucilaginibacter yixingensis TaxID=1295612 RepID=A0A2T5JAV5_9SPHI|nr:LysM peptidoglycan-binding domain-containing protein [Mucilaginibacter yixingensis]PTQ97994.1 LysM domain-containing protein [Mucilaginibacter yixingensis]